MIDGQRAALATAETAMIVGSAQLIPFGIRVGSGIAPQRTPDMLRSPFVLSPAPKSFGAGYQLFALFFGALAFIFAPFGIGFILLAMPFTLPSPHIRRVLVFGPSSLLCALFIVLTRACFGHFLRSLAATFLHALAICWIVLVSFAGFSFHSLAVLRIGVVQRFALIVHTLPAPRRQAIACLFGRWKVRIRLLSLTFRACFHRNSISQKCFYEYSNLFISARLGRRPEQVETPLPVARSLGGLQGE